MRRPEFIAHQAACPSGLLGRCLGRVMAVETADANRAAVALLNLGRRTRGATVLRLAVALVVSDTIRP